MCFEANEKGVDFDMIAYIKGKVGFKSINYVVIEINGVGYKIFMPTKSLQEIEIKNEIKVFTYMKVSEDDVSLYGFITNEELAMFELLISVGGIGAKSAINILSNIEPSKFALAVITDDVNTLKKLPGIGPKTAQRIILELKDKLKSEQAIEPQNAEDIQIKLNPNLQDAIDALQVLGYTRVEIEKTLSEINTSSMSVEEIIKEGLKLFAR